MPRAFALLLAFLLLAGPAFATGTPPSGKFSVVNSAGFIQQDGKRHPIATDRSVGEAVLSNTPEGSLMVRINGSAFQLYPLEDGLAALQWDAHGTALLHDIDIQAFLDGKEQEDIPVWGADLAWPGLGRVRLVLLPLGPNALTGFLISHPQGRTIVRQMEFRQTFGPSGRQQLSVGSTAPGGG